MLENSAGQSVVPFQYFEASVADTVAPGRFYCLLSGSV